MTILRNLALRKRFQSFKSRIPYKRATTAMRRHPLRSFLLSLGILLLVIILASVISNLGKKPTQTQELVKSVHVYRLGKSPEVAVQAKVQKSGVVTIVAQAPGIVTQINAQEGSPLVVGTNLIQLSSNYEGGNAAALQAQLAQTQYNNVTATFDAQKEIIAKQREVADKTSTNTEELRKITDSSEGETRALLSLNESILNTLNDQLQTAEQTGTPAQILAARQLKAQQQAGVNQLRSALRGIEFQTNTDNPPTKLANLQKDIALKQLEIQEKALEMSKEVSRIQLNLAYVNAALMHPTSPVSGVVDRVHVELNQSVNPGTPLVTITGDSTTITAVAQVTRDVAQAVSRIDMSTLHIGNKTYTTYPAYVSQNATEGNLYSVLYTIPASYAKALTDNEFISVDLPVTAAQTGNTIPYIPIDSIYQTQEDSVVYVVEKNRAVSRKVKLGTLYGDYVEVVSGLKNNDTVIIDRTVVSDEKVKIAN